MNIGIRTLVQEAERVIVLTAERDQLRAALVELESVQVERNALFRALNGVLAGVVDEGNPAYPVVTAECIEHARRVIYPQRYSGAQMDGSFDDRAALAKVQS